VTGNIGNKMEEEKSLLTEINRDIWRHFWYSKNEVLYEIIKCSQYREVVFLDKDHQMPIIRCMFIYKVDNLKEHFKQYHFMNSFSYNMYISCALLKNTPPFSFDYIKRREQMSVFSGNADQKGTYLNSWSGYDMFFDFDSNNEEDIYDAYKDALKVKSFFDTFQINYCITFSGAKGFHIRVPFKSLPQGLGLRLVAFCKIFAEKLKVNLNLPTLDTGIFDDRRIIKAPYSFDRGNICLPLSDDQFNNFNITKMKVTNVLKDVKIFNRGLLWRNDQKNPEEQQQCFLNMIKAINKE
jgi:hypothetical protein